MAGDLEDFEIKGSNAYLNVDNISNVPVLKKWGKAMVTE